MFAFLGHRAVSVAIDANGLHNRRLWLTAARLDAPFGGRGNLYLLFSAGAGSRRQAANEYQRVRVFPTKNKREVTGVEYAVAVPVAVNPLGALSCSEFSYLKCETQAGLVKDEVFLTFFDGRRVRIAAAVATECPSLYVEYYAEQIRK